ncbi:ABC transporter ATP-binding protein [Streptomyces sp. NBC_00144]|uniref:AAA family ATPase n=1 Tax=unclassified Streptomyces TaxID=2593676 RepID=UPI003249617A|nr:ABC transporter ATP-binding protein [Streptomyces sp. NBC_00932]
MVGQEWRRADAAPEVTSGGPRVTPGRLVRPGREAAGRRPPAVRDLRRRAGRSPDRLVFAAGDVVVLSGLPGSGKSTLLRRAAGARGIDSQDTRDRWERRMPGLLPYWSYRPLVRAAHYGRLWRVLRSGAGVVVHDCGTHSWVRALLVRAARRRRSALHLLLLDVAPGVALAGQTERGRKVSAYAFARHRRAVAGLVRNAERARLPAGCGSVVLLDRDAAAALRRIGFGAAV